MANQCGREPRRRRRLIFLSAGVDSPRGKLPNFRAQCRLWRVFSDAFSAAFFHSDRSETTRGKEGGRRCCFETVGSVVALPESTPAGLGKTGIGEDIARRGHFGSIAIAFPPADLPVQGAKSDVRQPIKRSRRSCGVAVATYEDTNRSGRKICTMRYLGSVAMDNSPRELTCRAEKEPIMANQLGRARRRQCRLGYFSGGVDRTDGKKTN